MNNIDNRDKSTNKVVPINDNEIIDVEEEEDDRGEKLEEVRSSNFAYS